MRKSSFQLLVILALAALATAASADRQLGAAKAPVRSFTASVSCNFAGPGRRGGCSALPTGAGFTYAFFASGPITIGSGPATSPFRSAICHGAGSVSVRVTDAAGVSAWASTPVSCT